MKKIKLLLTVLLVSLITFSLSSNDAQAQTKTCSSKNNVETCVYKNNNKVVKKRITSYRTNGNKLQRSYSYYNPYLYKKIVYSYNKQGKLMSNKYGNAKRETYYYNHKTKLTEDGLVKISKAYYNSKSQINKTVTGLYGTDIMVYSYTSFYSNGKKKQRIYKNYAPLLTRKTIYNYNRQGKLMSNKYGNATKTAYYYKSNDGGYSIKLYKRLDAKYNSKGKFINIKIINY